MQKCEVNIFSVFDVQKAEKTYTLIPWGFARTFKKGSACALEIKECMIDEASGEMWLHDVVCFIKGDFIYCSHCSVYEIIWYIMILDNV